MFVRPLLTAGDTPRGVTILRRFFPPFKLFLVSGALSLLPGKLMDFVIRVCTELLKFFYREIVIGIFFFLE